MYLNTKDFIESTIVGEKKIKKILKTILSEEDVKGLRNGTETVAQL